VAAAFVATLLVTLVPASASAQGSGTRVVLYEVWEALELRGPIKNADPEAFRRRFADAGLLGTAPEGASADSVFGHADAVVAEATSNVDINPRSRQAGTGPIRGEFQLLRFMNPNRPDDVAPNLAELVVIAEGRLQGTLDLRPAIGGVAPIAPVSGTWQLKGENGRQNRFDGLFLIPVSLPPDLMGLSFYVVPSELASSGVACTANVPPAILDALEQLPPELRFVVPAGFTTCLLEAHEFVLGFALTKAVIFLHQ
jgi:hypothetical protein